MLRLAPFPVWLGLAWESCNTPTQPLLDTISGSAPNVGVPEFGLLAYV